MASEVVTVLGAVLGRQQEFEAIGPPTDYDCHLYLVSARPRMSVDPTTVVISDTKLSFVLRLRRGDDFDAYPIDASHSLGAGPWRWESTWPFEDFALVHEVTGVRAMSGVVALLEAGAPGDQWPGEARHHDVLYVGQAFGRDGERTAWDRLKSHSTLQRILAEAAPDRQVWLTLAAVTDVQGAQLMHAPDGTPESRDAEKERDMRIIKAIYHDDSFRDRDSVALAEAGLIRYFQPPYNVRLRDKFPAPRQVPLETARSFDFHSLIIELQGEALGALYGSSEVPHDLIHFKQFVIHADADRADPFSFLEPAPEPNEPR